MTDLTTHQPDIAKVFAALSASFSEQELRTLCLELHIEYEDLPPGGKTDKARELALRCQRERRLPELVEAIVAARPHIPRHGLPPSAPPPLRPPGCVTFCRGGTARRGLVYHPRH
ncbi:MAG TPA: hypothetical protein PLD25_17790 [Chloroflexota bacterium]|nr:hypothetical protein [Chloroflexota bacterium]